MRTFLPVKQIAAVGALVAALAAAPAAPAAAAPDPVQAALDRITAAGVPGAEAVVTDHGHVTVTRSGVGDPATGRPPKTFVATVVLQLTGEGRIGLDAPVGSVLPGLIAGHGNDGGAITVRQLLQHTSGLYDYTTDFAGRNPETLRHAAFTPAELVALAVRHEPVFAPGAGWAYSNTDYIVLGMLVEKVTGRPLAAEVAQRIAGPLGLRGTYLPGPGDERLPSPHAVGYLPLDGALVDFSDFDPSIVGAAGALISTPQDLNRFFTALLGGRLLKAPQLAEMRRGVPAVGLGAPGARYGLGLGILPLPCGGEISGHAGSLRGFSTLSGVTGDGRAVTVVADQYPQPDAAAAAQLAAAVAAACPAQGPGTVGGLR